MRTGARKTRGAARAKRRWTKLLAIGLLLCVAALPLTACGGYGGGYYYEDPYYDPYYDPFYDPFYDPYYDPYYY